MRRFLTWFSIAALLGVACKQGSAPAEGQVPADKGAAAPGAKPADDVKQFTIAVTTPAAKAGSKAEMKVVIKAATGYKWNMEYPAAFKVATVPAGVKLDKAEFETAAFQAKEKGPEATLAIPFEAVSPGTASLEGTANFSVCNDDACLVYRNEKVAWVVQVD